jgi:hypothetical protein|tara:strand:+ start:79 stop:543 length:465 start_codon:yes stop_codon:yes gene_type:complete
MKKNFYIFLLLLFLSSCGYEALYSIKNKDNYNFSISDLNFIGDREINVKIKDKLNNYTLKQKEKNFILNITSNSQKIITSKNITGDATSFQNIITLNIEISMNDGFENSFIILEKFNYNNTTNKFDLKTYEKEIKNNLTETATNKLIFKLSNIQ